MHVACAVLRQFVSLGQAEIRHVAGFCRIRKMRKTGFRPEPELRLWEGQNLGRPIYGSRLCSVGGVDWGGRGKAENEYGDGAGGERAGEESGPGWGAGGGARGRGGAGGKAQDTYTGGASTQPPNFRREDFVDAENWRQQKADHVPGFC